MAPTLVTSCTALPPEGAAAARGGPSLRRRRHLLLLGASALAGCGFELRKAPNFAFQSISIGGVSSGVASELRRTIGAGGNVQALPAGTAADRAQVVLDILDETREKVVVGLTASGQVREYQLRTKVKFKLRTPQGKELIPETELQQQRDVSFSESAVLAKQAEEGVLYRDMQTDLVQQLMRRLAAVKTL